MYRRSEQIRWRRKQKHQETKRSFGQRHASMQTTYSRSNLNQRVPFLDFPLFQDPSPSCSSHLRLLQVKPVLPTSLETIRYSPLFFPLTFQESRIARLPHHTARYRKVEDAVRYKVWLRKRSPRKYCWIWMARMNAFAP